MKTIKLHGEVGWEIWASSVVSQLSSVGGDDVTVDFSSPGGDVFEGVEIYNAFSDFKRNHPNSKIIFEVKGIAASMGSYIISNPAIDEVKIEANASYMIHNPWLFAVGDYKAMQKKAEFLEGLTKMVAPSYSNVSGKSLDDIRTLMDDETWLFGQEIVDEGFADSIISVESQLDKAVALSKSKMSFTNMRQRFEELEKEKEFDTDRAAAILKTETPAPVDEIKPVDSGQSKMEVTVETKQELQKEKPELYSESVNDGVMKERDRVKSLSEMKAKDEYKGIPEVVLAIDKAIADGTTVAEAQPLVMAAMVALVNDPKKLQTVMAANESPEDIDGGSDPKPTMKTKKQAEV